MIDRYTRDLRGRGARRLARALPFVASLRSRPLVAGAARRVRLDVLLAVMIGLVASPALSQLETGNNARSIVWDGIDRPYIVNVPPGWEREAPTPLVVAIHGFLSNPQAHQSLSGMSAVSDEEGFLVVYPEGAAVSGARSWNAGICCQAQAVAQDDLGFIRALLDAVRSEAAIDEERVYATGLSNGGAMTHFLACEATELFAAAAPVAFGLPFSPLTECRPSRPIPVMNFMGLNDILVPYDGSGVSPSAQDTFARWRDINECGDETPEIVEVSGGSDCTIDTSCRDGVETALCSVDSRSFPGTAFEGHILYANDDVDIARRAWSFLSQFTRTMEVPEPGAGLLQATALAALALLGRRSRRGR